MRAITFAVVVSCLNAACSIPAFAQTDPINTLVRRLDLARYKTTIKGLTQFGDRKQGTDRNRAAVNWIEVQLQSYGCPTESYASDYPAAVGNHMTNTDSDPFMDLVPAISLRENERGMQLGAGWNPHYHQASDLYSTYSDKDFASA